jgi:hypothetical protein
MIVLIVGGLVLITVCFSFFCMCSVAKRADEWEEEMFKKYVEGKDV